jgi:hypothetical protein
MINMGSDSRRDNPVRPRLINEERLWRENFETRVWNAVNEMRYQIKNNRREVCATLFRASHRPEKRTGR